VSPRETPRVAPPWYGRGVVFQVAVEGSWWGGSAHVARSVVCQGGTRVCARVFAGGGRGTGC